MRRGSLNPTFILLRLIPIAIWAIDKADVAAEQWQTRYEDTTRFHCELRSYFIAVLGSKRTGHATVESSTFVQIERVLKVGADTSTWARKPAISEFGRWQPFSVETMTEIFC